MPLENLFSQLKLDSWYKVFVYMFGITLVLSFFIEVKGITNTQLQLISAGFLCIGLGEWKNAWKAIYYQPPNIYTGPGARITVPVRKLTLLGFIFDAVGGIFLLLGLISIVRQ